jgi:hypothetical protein
MSSEQLILNQHVYRRKPSTLATLFFLLGLPHVYSVLRKRSK